ncbi:CsbD family protein [Actinospongicola halichondriae]|uniref:CsbD family protein n=1 Tax=Actinospongicola halichondriae TaxID=3236844 RepID=UPI003D3F618B
MSEDSINKDEIKGRAKEAAGVVTGNDDLENEGKLDQVVGDVKDAVDGVADKVKGLLKRDK